MNHGHDTPPTAGANAAQRELQRAADAESDAAFIDRIDARTQIGSCERAFAECLTFEERERIIRMLRALTPPSVEFCAEIVVMVRHRGHDGVFKQRRDEAAEAVRAKLTAFMNGDAA